MPVTEINSYDEFKAAISSGKPAIIDFWATWCGPCRIISPIFEKFSEEDSFSNVAFYKVDVDAQERIAAEVGIRAMPTFALFHNGEKHDVVLGARPQEIQALLTKGASFTKPS